MVLEDLLARAFHDIATSDQPCISAVTCNHVRAMKYVQGGERRKEPVLIKNFGGNRISNYCPYLKRLEIVVK